jgi:glucokinase
MKMLTEPETRWIVVGTDTRHVSLGRTEPSEWEVLTTSNALAAQAPSG